MGGIFNRYVGAVETTLYNVSHKSLVVVTSVALLAATALPVVAATAPESDEQVLLQRGAHYVEQRRPDLAIQAFTQVLAIDPGQPDALYQLGTLSMQNGDIKAAQQFFDRLRRAALGSKVPTKHLTAAKPGASEVAASTALAKEAPAIQADVALPDTPAPSRAALRVQPAPGMLVPPAPGVFVAGLDSPTATPPPAQPATDQFSISPRTWFLFEDRELLTVPNPTESFIAPGSIVARTSTQSSPSTLMGGLSLSATSHLWPDTTFTLSYLRGTSTTSGQFTDFVSNSTAGTPGGSVDYTETAYTRNDIEALAQTRFTDPDLANFSWIAGFRAELSDFNENVHGFTAGSSSNYNQQFTDNFYSLKGGLGYALPISANGDHELFGNFLGVFGVNDVSASNVVIGGSGSSCASGLICGGAHNDSPRIGNDFAVGYQYHYSDSLSFDLRYRVLVSYIFAVPKSQVFGTTVDHFYVQQGPMLELTWRF